MNVLIITISSLIMSWIQMHIGSRIINKKIKYKHKKFWIYYLLFAVYLNVSYIATDNFIRIIITYAILAFCLAKIFNSSLTKSIVTSF